jgi:hypothetical protein
VKDRLTSKDGATIKRLPARIRPRFRDQARDSSPVIRAMLKSGVQGQETVAKRPASTVRRTRDNRGGARAQAALGAWMRMSPIIASGPQRLRGLLFIDFRNLVLLSWG